MTTMKEEWKPLEQFEHLFDISDKGRAWDKIRNEEKHLSPAANGYLRLCFQENGIDYFFYMHILVANAFIDNPENKPEVHHINGDKTDNRKENLMFVTRKEHMLIHAKTHPRCKAIEMFTLDWQHEEYFPSIHEAGRQTGLDHRNIHKVLHGDISQTGGHRFRYISQG